MRRGKGRLISCNGVREMIESNRHLATCAKMEAEPYLRPSQRACLERRCQPVEIIGGRDRDRTCDPHHVKVVRYRCATRPPGLGRVLGCAV
jgi:hypothetical protein